MPPMAARSAPRATVTAPDGMGIHTFDLPVASYLGVAEGWIPRGEFAVHRHLTIEQYTYVISGQLQAVTGDPNRGGTSTIELRAGDLFLTLPGESLQFANRTAVTARVLFICAPPYPADDSDTRVIAAHLAETEEERRVAVLRLQELRASMDAVIESRIAELQGVGLS
jgi:mannose-6-phosphate isomerase-like protein (cupin superfamily)